MKVRYTETSLEEIESILSHIAKDNRSAALKASAAILSTIARLVEFPSAAVQTDTPGVRMAPVLPYRYIVFFSVTGDVLVVRNVRHSRQRSLF